MLYREWTVKDKTFKLRLTTMGAMALEDKLGKNPADLFVALSDGQLPKIRDVVTVLHQSLQAYHSGYSFEKAASLLDSYFEEGKTIYEFLTSTIMEVFQDAGLLAANDEEEDEEGQADPN